MPNVQGSVVKERGKKNKKPQSIHFDWGFFFANFLIKFQK